MSRNLVAIPLFHSLLAFDDRAHEATLQVPRSSKVTLEEGDTLIVIGNSAGGSVAKDAAT